MKQQCLDYLKEILRIYPTNRVKVGVSIFEDSFYIFMTPEVYYPDDSVKKVFNFDSMKSLIDTIKSLKRVFEDGKRGHAVILFIIKDNINVDTVELLKKNISNTLNKFDENKFKKEFEPSLLYIIMNGIFNPKDTRSKAVV